MKSLIHKPLSLITKTRIRGLDAFNRCIRRLSEEPTLRCLVQEEIEAKSAYRHRLNRRSKKRASVHWPSFVPETMSSAQKKCLQHRFNRWGIGAYHRCNDVSVQEKIPSAPVEPVKHRCIASVQPVVSASAVRSPTATSGYE